MQALLGLQALRFVMICSLKLSLSMRVYSFAQSNIKIVCKFVLLLMKTSDELQLISAMQTDAFMLLGDMLLLVMAH